MVRRIWLGALLTSVVWLVAGCGSSATSAGPSGPSDSASPSGEATVSTEPSATATASIEPSASAVGPLATLSAEHLAVLEAMADKMAYPTASYRVNGKMRMAVGVVFNYTFEYAVSGEDLEMLMTMGTGTLEMDMRMVATGGYIYVKSGQMDWVAVEYDETLFESMKGEWDFVTEPGNFVFLRADKMNGRDVLVFTNARPIPRPTEDNDYIKNADIYLTEMTLTVLPDGTPLTVSSSLEGTATVSGSPQDVTGSVDYEFSDVGKPIQILAPTL